jgi:arsenite methyltransferase
METHDVHESVQEYYGKTLETSDDLKTNACCTAVTYPDNIKSALSKIHDEVMQKYYGCGLTIPTDLKGLRVLDLGSGSGRDCYVLSQLVGESGSVVGVDMTQEQLDVANRHLDFHKDKFGFANSNVEFVKGNIDHLDELNLEPNSFDLIVSNCVINLVKDKPKVFTEAFRLLKEGGEMYFSDVYSERRIPEALKNDPEIYGECLGGALYWNDFLRMAKAAGFTDPRLVEDDAITVNNKAMQEKLGAAKFYSATYRLFKIAGLESDCEDFGQAIIYKGTDSDQPDVFKLDDHHYFEKGKAYHVCGNSYLMLHATRFQEHFEFVGTWDTHYGIFPDCGKPIPFSASISTEPKASPGGACC